MEQKEKYRVVFRPSIYKTEIRSPTQTYQTWEAQLNKLYEVGYEIFPNGIQDDFIIIHLKELGQNDYSNVTNLKDVPPSEVDDYIADGWEITSTSISTKFVRMVKRG